MPYLTKSGQEGLMITMLPTSIINQVEIYTLSLVTSSNTSDINSGEPFPKYMTDNYWHFKEIGNWLKEIES